MAFGQQLNPGHDGKSNLIEALGDHARADGASRIAAAEAQSRVAKTCRHQAYRKKIAREVQCVSQIVSSPDTRQRLIHHDPQVGFREAVRAADADVELAVVSQ